MKNSHPLITARTSSFVEPETSVQESAEPVIRLKVDKPPHWAWELTTSADTLPVIQLLDKDGRLLVETTGRTAQRARGSFRDGLKSFEEFPSRVNSSSASREDRSSRTSSSFSSVPTPPVPQGNRNIDGLSTKFGYCDFGYKPRKSRSDVSVGVKTKRELKTRDKRHSTGLDPTSSLRSEESTDSKKIPKRYSTGDYLRQQILDDLRSRNNAGKSSEDVARERCRKVKAYLRSQSDLLLDEGKVVQEEESPLLPRFESPAKQLGDVSADARDIQGDGSTGINGSYERTRSAIYSRDERAKRDLVEEPDPRNRTLKKYHRCRTEELPQNDATPGKSLEKRTKSMSRQDTSSRMCGKFEGASRQGSFSRTTYPDGNGEQFSAVADDDQSEFKKPRICGRTRSDIVSKEDATSEAVEKQDLREGAVKNEELERIKAFLREKIGEKMSRESRNCLRNDLVKTGGIQKRYSDSKQDGRENYRTRKVRSETNIVRFNPEEKFHGSKESFENSPDLQRRSSSRQRFYRPSRSDIVLENPETSETQESRTTKVKRNSSGSEKKKFYRKTKSDLLLGQIGSSVESEQDFGQPPRRTKSQDNVERSWREYKERKRHERLQRDSEKDVAEEDFMSKPRWKDLQLNLCPARNCKVCQNLEDSFDSVAEKSSRSAEYTDLTGCSNELARREENLAKEENKDVLKAVDRAPDSMECSSAESRPGTSLQENYLLLDPRVARDIPEDPKICKVQATVKASATPDLKSPDFGYNTMQKNLLKNYKDMCARSNVKKSDTFKIVDGSEDPEECPEEFDQDINAMNDSSKDLASLSNKSNEDIAKDYFKRVYELLKKRQEEARRVAEGTREHPCEDSSSSNYIEEVQRKRPRRKRRDRSVEGEEVITVPPTAGGQDGWKNTQQERLASNVNDLPSGENRRTYRSRLQSVSGNRRPRPAPPPPPISAKVNAKDISKYFDHQPNKENTPGNARRPETLSERTHEARKVCVADAMGSNLSRHNGKGLTGRRTQSSGNLCDPKGKLNSVGKILVPCSTAHRQRYKFCGSLPNHLDDKDAMDDESRENNNVMSDTITGNLGGTLPHKKRSLGVHFSDSGPTGALDLVKHRSQDSLDENDPWRYHQSDLDLVRCRHGNFDSVRRNRSADTVATDSGRRYTRVTSSENRCQRNTELDLVGTLPRRKQESRASGKSLETISTSSSQQSAVKEPTRDEELLMKVFHKPDCELVKRRQPAKCVDLKFGKLGGGEPQDQGYASERSPEDEHPPSLPGQPFPSVTPESTFRVTLQKSSRGLGLSVSGGGTDGPVRVKRLFPQQPAALSNKLQVGDILLAANGIPLTGLTNYEALEVLRTTSSTVELVVCRLPGDTNVTPPGSPPPPPARREPPPPLRILNPLPPLQIEPCGEFDIEMTKVGGSLGFTLRKADSSALGHYVRALVREPALSDGRIRPGDKIVAVDGAPLSPMSHEEAVALLRQCGPKVKLRLYRDLAQTPVSALSPTEPDHPLRPPRTSLRQEAVDMLCDLAVRKLSPGTSSGSSCRQSSGTSCNSPRRVRRLATRTPVSDTDQDPVEKLYDVQTTCSTGSQVETSDSDQCSIKTQITNSQLNTPATDIIDPPALYDECDSSSRTSTAARPSFLDLSAPQDKPHFQFSLEADREERTARGRSRKSSSLDVNVGYERRDVGQGLSSDEQDNDLPSEPASMPPLHSSSAQTASGTGGFSYKNPAYQSANPACGAIEVAAKSKATHSSDQDIPGKVLGAEDPAGTKGLLKWKGVMFAPDDGLNKTEKDDDKTDGKPEETAVSTSDPEQGNEVFMVELTRGWNSRLGFSLQPEGNRTVISVVHPDSVAAKDGRLKQGDVLLMVNDESVENMSTADIIDLLRKIRGSIGITVMRRCNRENPT